MTESSSRDIGRYQIKSFLCETKMARIYLAYDPSMDRKVIIKEFKGALPLNQEARQRFKREVKLISSLEHPAIVPVYDYIEDSESLFLVMRYMPGGSLKDRLTKTNINIANMMNIYERIVGALEYVHRSGIIHRDIKPANILFDRNDLAYLSDFGIAKQIESDLDLTGENLIGTLAYMSPEQFSSEKHIDHRTDIYALGVMLFESVTGFCPYIGGSVLDIASKHLHNPIPDVTEFESDLPPQLNQIIQKAMAKNPDDRYSDASELLDDLSIILLDSQKQHQNETGAIEQVRGEHQETISIPGQKSVSLKPISCMVCGYEIIDPTEACPGCHSTRHLNGPA